MPSFFDESDSLIGQPLQVRKTSQRFVEDDMLDLGNVLSRLEQIEAQIISVVTDVSHVKDQLTETQEKLSEIVDNTSPENSPADHSSQVHFDLNLDSNACSKDQVGKKMWYSMARKSTGPARSQRRESKRSDEKQSCSTVSSMSFQQLGVIPCHIFQGRVWDVLLIAGLRRAEGRAPICSQIVMYGVFVLLVLLQSIFSCTFYWYMGFSELEQETLTGFAQWRLTTGHDIKYYNENDGTSLVSRVCDRLSGNGISSLQQQAYSTYEDYLPREPEPPVAPIVCLLVLFVWFLHVGEELALATGYLNGVLSLPRRSNTHLALTGDQYTLKSISTCRFWSILLFVIVPRIGVVLFLGYTGIGYLILFANETEDILMNGVALSFVLDLDKLLYDALIPSFEKTMLENTTPLGKQKQQLVKVFMIGVGSFVALLICIPARMFKHLSQVREAQRLLCDGDRAFVYAVDTATGVLATAQTIDARADLSQFVANYRFQAVLQRTGLVTENTLQDFSGKIPVQSLSSSQSISKVARMSYESEGESGSQLPCIDLIGLNQTTGSDNNVSALRSLQQLLKNTSFRSCAELLHMCSKPKIQYFCPRSCGCHEPSNGMFFREGCSQQCLTERLQKWNLELTFDSLWGAKLAYPDGSYLAGRCSDFFSTDLIDEHNLMFDARRFFQEYTTFLLQEGMLVQNGSGVVNWSPLVKQAFGSWASFKYKLSDAHVDLHEWYVASLVLPATFGDSWRYLDYLWETCKWVRGYSDYDVRDRNLAWVTNPHECILLVKEYCPNATYAMTRQGNNGDLCWCMYGDNLAVDDYSVERFCNVTTAHDTLSIPVVRKISGYVRYQDASSYFEPAWEFNASSIGQCAANCTAEPGCFQFGHDPRTSRCRFWPFYDYQRGSDIGKMVLYIKSPDPEGARSAMSWKISRCHFVSMLRLLVSSVPRFDPCLETSSIGSLRSICKEACGLCATPPKVDRIYELISLLNYMGLPIVEGVVDRCKAYPQFVTEPWCLPQNR